ncbi:MAG: hypothetical protein J6K70_05560 [Selenomonadales bacterium]|nr:hypothetical protein [Selenomonadales bacterium]
MMTRLILTICMMMTLLMPCAWAEEKPDIPFEIPQEFAEAWQHVQQGTDSKNTPSPRPLHTPDTYYTLTGTPLKIDSPLTKLLVETENWTKDNTYYIHHTLINPTDELIEGDLDYITISYGIHFKKEKPVSRTQYSDVTPTISLPPHSSYSFITTLNINEPFEYIEFYNSIFHFTDGSTLSYRLEHDGMLPKVLITPIILPSGEIYLAMKNHHFFKTITDIRNIRLTASFLKKSDNGIPKIADYQYIDSTPLPIRLKPQETVFFRLPHSFELNSDLFSPSTILDVTIHDVSHKFSFFPPNIFRHSSDYSAENYTKHSAEYYTSSIFEKYGIDSFNASGTYETDDTTLHGYLRIKNPHDKGLLLSHGKALLALTYCKPDNTQGYSFHDAYFPTQVILAPQDTILLSFSLPLPQDISKHLRLTALSISTRNFFGHNEITFTQEKLTSFQKKHYMPISVK